MFAAAEAFQAKQLELGGPEVCEVYDPTVSIDAIEFRHLVKSREVFPLLVRYLSLPLLFKFAWHPRWLEIERKQLSWNESTCSI